MRRHSVTGGGHMPDRAARAGLCAAGRANGDWRLGGAAAGRGRNSKYLAQPIPWGPS